MSDIKFIDGLSFKAPNERAPEYVKAKVWIQRDKLIAWLQSQPEDSINADVKVSQGGKWYAAVDNWKPEGRGDDKPQRQERPARGGGGQSAPSRGDEPFPDDGIPFASPFGDF